MITWCRPGQRAWAGRLSASLFDVGRGLGHDSQSFAVHRLPVAVGDQALNTSVRALMPKWSRLRRTGDAGLPADSHRWRLRKLPAHAQPRLMRCSPPRSRTGRPRHPAGAVHPRLLTVGRPRRPAGRGSGRARAGHRDAVSASTLATAPPCARWPLSIAAWNPATWRARVWQESVKPPPFTYRHLLGHWEFCVAVLSVVPELVSAPSSKRAS